MRLLCSKTVILKNLIKRSRLLLIFSKLVIRFERNLRPSKIIFVSICIQKKNLRKVIRTKLQQKNLKNFEKKRFFSWLSSKLRYMRKKCQISMIFINNLLQGFNNRSHFEIWKKIQSEPHICRSKKMITFYLQDRLKKNFFYSIQKKILIVNFEFWKVKISYLISNLINKMMITLRPQCINSIRAINLFESQLSISIRGPRTGRA